MQTQHDEEGQDAPPRPSAVVNVHELYFGSENFHRIVNGLVINKYGSNRFLSMMMCNMQSDVVVTIQLIADAMSAGEQDIRLQDHSDFLTCGVIIGSLAQLFDAMLEGVAVMCTLREYRATGEISAVSERQLLLGVEALGIPNEVIREDCDRQLLTYSEACLVSPCAVMALGCMFQQLSTTLNMYRAISAITHSPTTTHLNKCFAFDGGVTCNFPIPALREVLRARGADEIAEALDKLDAEIV